MRMMPVVAHSWPSPNGLTSPVELAWMNRAGPGMSVAVRTSVSAAGPLTVSSLASPALVRSAPPGNAWLPHPRPVEPVLPHGAGAPVPSHLQNAVDGVVVDVTVNRNHRMSYGELAGSC